MEMQSWRPPQLSNGNELHQPCPATGVHRQGSTATTGARGGQDSLICLYFQQPDNNSPVPICQLCHASETSTWWHLKLLCLVAQCAYVLTLACWSYSWKQPNWWKKKQKDKNKYHLLIQERTTPYHEDSKISRVMTPASRKLVSFFCTASGAPVVDSVVSEDTGMVMQLQFGCVALWIATARRKSGYRNRYRYAPANGTYCQLPSKRGTGGY